MNFKPGRRWSEKVNAIRTHFGFSQQQMAFKVGCSWQSVFGWEQKRDDWKGPKTPSFRKAILKLERAMLDS